MFSLLLCLPVSSNFINLDILFLLDNLTKFCQSLLSLPRTNLHVIASSQCTVGVFVSSSLISALVSIIFPIYRFSLVCSCFSKSFECIIKLSV